MALVGPQLHNMQDHMENQIRIPNSESTDPDLSDITKIRNIPWSKLKTIAVQENFE